MRRTVGIVGVVVLAMVAGAGALVYLSQDDEPRLATAEVSRYLAGWERFDAAAMAEVVEGPAEGLAEAVARMQADLRVTQATFTTESVEEVEAEQRATYRADVEVAGVGHLQYEGHLRLVKQDDVDEWRVVWDPSALHPDLTADRHFDLGLSWPTRAPILGRDGGPLVSTADTVLVGLQPGRVQDLAQVQAVLNQQLGTDPAAVAAALDAPGVQPDQFVAVEQVPRDRFTPLRAALEPVPGIFFRPGSGRLAPSADFAAHVIGQVGEITAERLAELGPPYVVGDQVGLSGLEAASERQLAGAPSAEVRIVDSAGTAVAVVAMFPGRAPEALALTLDRRVQEAADQALAGVDKPAAIVAIDAATGEVRAVSSRPLDEGFNRALHGRYPPGSSFKVVTAEALLRSGVRPDTTVACEPTVTIDGKSFKNFEDEAFGPIPFRDAFAHSCNTAFVTQADALDDDALAEAARRFGFGVEYEAGVGGEFPDPGDDAERAAAAIGQARVLASPLHMASVAAAAASGSWRAPRLLASAPATEAIALDPPTVAILGDLMREVVRTGTGTAAAVPGQDVAGKTGTAEFGTADPPETHAWFIGFRGSLAFAVLVEGGGVGGQVAAPIAARFLTAAP